jgi:hypothetical protein
LSKNVKNVLSTLFLDEIIALLLSTTNPREVATMLRRMSSSFLSSTVTGVFIAILTVCLGVNDSQGVGLIYADGDPEFALNVTPQTAFGTAPNGTDNAWGKRIDFGAGATVWEAANSEDVVSEITQTISGLTPGNSYDVYAVYWTDNDENWTIRSGVTSGNLTAYSWTGNAGSFPEAGSVQGAPAALAEWDPAGLPPAGPPATGIQLFTERVTNPPTALSFGIDDPLVMMLGKAGTAVADGSGNVSVIMNDIGIVTGAKRGWYDGVAYKPMEAGALTPTATFNRDTGSLTVNNATSAAKSIKAIRIEAGASSVSGSLNGTAWTSVSSTNGTWTAVADPSTANPAGTVPAATPFATNLVENGTTNVTLAASGGTLSFGNIWNASPFEPQFVIHLMLADDTLAVLTPQVTGTRVITNGDLDADGFINTTDYGTLMTNLHTSLAGLTRVAGYRRGDMTADGAINFADFAAFRTAYDIANGAGAFAQMVPEPGSLLLCLVGGAIAFGASRRRRSISVATCTLVLGLLTINTANAVPLIAVDFNDRETVALGTEVGNTQAGFQSFTLKGVSAPVAFTPEDATNGTTTNVLGAYTVSLVAFDDGLDEQNLMAGVQNTTGVVDDRDRATPVDGGALTNAQIYDDFIFANLNNGPTGGMNITVSGGTLVANKAYSVSIYSYDSGSGAPTRSANWFDATNTLAPVLSTSFVGSAANNPTNNDQYKYSGIVQANGSGVISLQGRSTTPYTTTGNGPANNGVFINALEINEFTGLTLEVNTTDGTTRLLNEQAGSLALGYYEIRSIGGSLNTGGWTSLDEGEGVDPVGTGWDEAGGSSANILSEGNLLGQSSLAGSGGFLPLGAAVTPAAAQDLRFFYAEFADSALRAGFVKYIGAPPGVAGDYNGNGVVDAADYVRWRNGGPLQNEVATIGTVTAEDYTEWRSRFGNTSGSGSSLGGGAIPEPTTSGLLALAISLAAIGRRRSDG